MKHKIEVEIPSGKYCMDYDREISCNYQGDAHFGAGCCALIVEGDSLIYWEDEEKAIMERAFKHIVKHSKCPSLYQVVRRE